ncbi:hypothetical protein [Micromonospora sp. NPDC005806]|uniref:hypothetical protein n=1 Tax=Micromonospora sp. NPDC005806 TaxID=3364234 RepID=UPI0036C85361
MSPPATDPVVVELDAADLAGALAAAQAALVAAPAGSVHEWRLPAPDPAAPPGPPLATLQLGAADRSLALVAAPAGPSGVGARVPLVVAAGPAADGITVTGLDVLVQGIALTVTGDADELTGLRVVATGRGAVRGVSVVVSAAAVTGVSVAAGGVAELVEVDLTGVRGTVATATGLVAQAPVLRAHRVTVADLVARTAARGVDLRALAPGGPGAAEAAALTASALRVSGLTGDDADAVRAAAGPVTLGGAPGDPGGADPGDDPESSGPAADTLTLLDVEVDAVAARAGTARGVGLAGAGLLDVRGVGVRDISGPVALGCEMAAAGGVELAGTLVRTVVGRDVATGVLLRASSARAPLRLDDVLVEDVRATGHADAVLGLAVRAPVSELAPWVDDDTDPGPVRLVGCALRRISGTALLVDADLRDVELSGSEVYAADRAGDLRGERVLVTATTWHRMRRGPLVGPCTLTLLDSLITQVAEGPALDLSAEAVVDRVAAVFAAPTDPAPLLAALPEQPGLPGDVLPYLVPGPATVPAALSEGRFVPDVPVDLRLRPDAGLHELAVPVPAEVPGADADPEAALDAAVPQVGAYAPIAPAGCELRDPLAVAPPAPAGPAPPGPVLDRMARDGRGLLGVMQARAAVALPGWAPGDAADLTTTVLEAVAHELDRISYAQDAALAEASMPSARLRRSVEEHARLVDYRPDPGLSATTMLRLRVPRPELLGLTSPDRPAPRPFMLGAGTVVVNPDAGEAPVVVSSEADLEWHAVLDELPLARDVRAGECFALIAGDRLPLGRDRWLVLAPAEADRTSSPHVVRATVVEFGTDETLVRWDPRRPAPQDYPAESTRVLGNVVPAHHGLRLPAAPDLAAPELAAQLAAVAADLDRVLEARADQAVELPLPFAPAARVASGWPFPGERREGALDVRVSVDGEPWRCVPDVAAEPGEAFAVAAGGDGGSLLVLGQPGALPDAPVRVSVEAVLGLGAAGNVAAHTLTSLLLLGPGSAVPPGTPLETVREALALDNPVPGVEGRDPEPLEAIRLRAPWAARRPAAAVGTDDHVRLLEELPEVAAARARVLELGERRVVRATLLLRDEDTLVPGGPDPADVDLLDLVRDAERLRRWTLARRRLEEVRLLGFDVELVPPTFVPIDLDVVVDAEDHAPAERLQAAVEAALAADGGLFDPDVTGLGGDVRVDAVLRRVLAVDGVRAARVRRLRRLERGAAEHAVDGTLPVADEEVAVLRRPYGDGPDGLLTVQVCGGLR